VFLPGEVSALFFFKGNTEKSADVIVVIGNELSPENKMVNLEVSQI